MWYNILMENLTKQELEYIDCRPLGEKEFVLLRQVLRDEILFRCGLTASVCGKQPKESKMIHIHKCLRCKHEWASKNEHPIVCPKCKSPYWELRKKQ